MPPKDVPNLGGKIRVDFPPGLAKYSVYKKEIPDELKQHPDYGNYEWVGSFGIIDDKGNKVSGRLHIPYEVQVEEVSGKNTLVYWDGSDIVPITQGRRSLQAGNRRYGAGHLHLGDPPVAWG